MKYFLIFTVSIVCAMKKSMLKNPFMKYLKLILLAAFALVSCKESSLDSETDADEAYYETYDSISDDITRFIEDNKAVTYDSIIDYVSSIPEVESTETIDDVLYINFVGGYTFLCDIYGITALGEDSWSFDEEELQHVLDSLTEEISVGEYSEGVEAIDDEFLSEIENDVLENGDAESSSETKSATVGSNITLLSRKTALIWSPFPEHSKEKATIQNLMKKCGIRNIREPSSYAPASMSIFNNYDFVVILTHGTPKGYPAVPSQYKSLYEKELKAGTVMKSTGGLILTEKFLKKYLPEMPKTIIWSIMCYSGADKSIFLNVAQQKNVADFFGCDNTVTSPIACSPMKDYIPKFFFAGLTSEKSFMNGRAYYKSGSMKGLKYYPCKYWRRGSKDVCYVKPETGAPGDCGNDYCVINVGISYPAELDGADLLATGIQIGVCLIEENSGKKRYITIPLSEQYTTFPSGIKSIQSRSPMLRNLSPDTEYRYVAYLKINGNYVFSDGFRRFKTGSAEDDVRAYLTKLYYDTNGDNWVNNTNWCSDKPIDEWYGVRFTTNNLDLNCGFLDIDLSENGLSGSIDLSGCTFLHRLSCDGGVFGDNRIESVDVSGCHYLESIDLSNNMELSHLNVSSCSNLEILNCRNNQLETLDVSDCLNLRELWCGENKLTNIDVTQNLGLIWLQCNANSLEKLDISQNRALESLDISDNPISELDVAHLAALKYYSCSSTDIQEVNVASNKHLMQLDCSYTSVSSLNLSGLSELELIACTDSFLEELVVDGCEAVTSILCWNNLLDRLDLSRLSNLLVLNCSRNEIVDIVLDGCNAIEDLKCNNNPLKDIDLDNLMNLKCFSCLETMICKEIPEWLGQIEYFSYIQRYEYPNYGEYRDKGYGWWYSGEPAKGYHGK